MSNNAKKGGKWLDNKWPLCYIERAKLIYFYKGKIIMTQMITLSSLAKIYADLPLDLSHRKSSGNMLKNDTYHFQVAYKSIVKAAKVAMADDIGLDDVVTVLPSKLKLKFESDLGDAVSIRYVDYVPCDRTADMSNFDACEHPKPGIFPDILKPVPERIWGYPDMWRGFWITIDGSEKDLPVGKHTISVTLEDKDGSDTASFEIEILDAKLDKQTLPVTNWLYCDCICNYFGVDFGSDEFWAILKNYIKAAVKNGVNMILTPVFTPALNTAIGGERLTNQLVDITVKDGEFFFNFDNLVKWIELCKECDVAYYEITPFFTQWGCKFAPKVMATVDGEYKQLYGWDTCGYGDEYLAFLDKLMPLLVDKLKENGIFDLCYFHISDEPTPETMGNYIKCADKLMEYIPKEMFFDAMRSVDIYKAGYVHNPVAALKDIDPFIEEGIDTLWGYYCQCEQHTANRLLAHASYRNRILGLQLFKYDIKGFLQWALNYYNSHDSLEPVDPYTTSTGYGWVPGGDTYVLYPNADGTVTESLRFCVFADAIRDFTALNMLLKKYSREELVKMLHFEDLTFHNFLAPHELLEIREKINLMLCEL